MVDYTKNIVGVGCIAREVNIKCALSGTILKKKKRYPIELRVRKLNINSLACTSMHRLSGANCDKTCCDGWLGKHGSASLNTSCI